ncbi:hypothetical protein NMY22_g4116 [Coprinellus aureogranulatus]|nr:hypothetical protein NMY22_g4116 [Coprinellus aureogranulatus]
MAIHIPMIRTVRARPRPGSGSDSAWRDSGVWAPGLAQSKSVASLSSVARDQADDASSTNPAAPRLRGMRSLLLTKPIVPKRALSDGPHAPDTSALRELARVPESAPPTAPGFNGRRFDPPTGSLPSIPSSSPPDVTKQFNIPAQAGNDQNRRYHYQKPLRSQSMEQEGTVQEKEKDKTVTSGWENEKERATLKKEKKSTPTPPPVTASPAPAAKVKTAKPSAVGPPKNNWVSSGLAMHGLTYNPNADYMPRRPANAGPPPPKVSKAEKKAKADGKAKADAKDQADNKSVKSSDSKSLADSDSKSVKDKKKGRMGSFVVKVLSNKGSKPPPVPPPPTPSTPAGDYPRSPDTPVSASSELKSEPKTEKVQGKAEVRPMMVMAYT